MSNAAPHACPQPPAADISVVIPTYNDGHLLAGCLASIAAQTLAPLEVILIDDGTDDPVALAALAHIAEAFPHCRLLRQTNRGPSAARNRGITAAHGTWLAFVDADDWLPPDSLARRRASLARHGDATASYGGVTFIEPDGRRHGSAYATGLRALPVDQIGNRDGVPGFLWAYLLAAAAVRNVGGLDESLAIMEDFDLLARLGGSGMFVVGDDAPCYIQQRRRGSLARGSARRQIAGALRFLAKARRAGYFSRGNLIRRYLRVPLAGAKIVWRYGRGG